MLAPAETCRGRAAALVVVVVFMSAFVSLPADGLGAAPPETAQRALQPLLSPGQSWLLVDLCGREPPLRIKNYESRKLGAAQVVKLEWNGDRKNDTHALAYVRPLYLGVTKKGVYFFSVHDRDEDVLAALAKPPLFPVLDGNLASQPPEKKLKIIDTQEGNPEKLFIKTRKFAGVTSFCLGYRYYEDGSCEDGCDMSLCMSSEHGIVSYDDKMIPEHLLRRLSDADRRAMLQACQ